MTGNRPALPKVKERKVDVKCCLVKASDSTFTFMDEEIARVMFSDDKRFYYMDGISWGNLLKVSAERQGRIKEYEQFPCVQK